MAAISQWDNKNSNQRLIKKKDQNNCFWTFVVHFAVECELIPPKVISVCKSNTDIPYTPPKYKKNRWNEKYSIFCRYCIITFEKFPLDVKCGRWEYSYHSDPMSVMFLYQQRTWIISVRLWMWKILSVKCNRVISMEHSKIKFGMLMYLICIEFNFRITWLTYPEPPLLCHWLWTVNLRWTHCRLTTPLNPSNRILGSLNPFPRVTLPNIFWASMDRFTRVTLLTLYYSFSNYQTHKSVRNWTFS